MTLLTHPVPLSLDITDITAATAAAAATAADASVRPPFRLPATSTMSACRCRSCGRWLSLDDDERDALLDASSPGVICWNCDDDAQWAMSRRDTR